MSSMLHTRFAALLLASALAFPLPATAQVSDPAAVAAEYDRNRAQLAAMQPGPMANAIARWQALSAVGSFSFNDYAGFLMQYPGMPDETRMRGFAEGRLSQEYADPGQVVAFFDRYPPLGNAARAQYALALMAVRPGAAADVAVQAWRGGEMAETAAATIQGSYGAQLTQADHDARMDALLWQRDALAAQRQLVWTSPAAQPVFSARLAILQGGDGAIADPGARADPGWLYNRSRELRQENRSGEAVMLAAQHPQLSRLPFDQTRWVEEQLAVARAADARSAVAIAARIDEAFEAGADISAKPYKLRDDYTSLVWLGGTQALWQLGDAASAAPLFYRYGNAARTGPTRSKGFYWAGFAAARAGDAAGAQRYYEMAAAYPDRFYGLLALTALGRPVPPFPAGPVGEPTAQERELFRQKPITAAVMEVARDAPWRTGIRFYRELADQATTVGENLLVAELAREIGRRDLAVNLLDSAVADGHTGFTRIGFPTVIPPAGTDWTMVHAIARQESQFAQNAISHAGARGLMQLMPGTAQEEANKAGIAYQQSSLIEDAGYNMTLGGNHIQRLYARYGSWPLAIAAYNAGPGNVNKWLSANGDPRTGSVSWIDWIERIPFFETKNYVTRVIENAVVYEQLYPEKAPFGRARGVEDFLR
ncbi:lytic transglycosylase domain-containing protein [Croceibacterium ferulae]|uniref:lytic transglycosylase domain-containing protein n=1 Tax=Croceibacterium ferulae TaxID=1854641 RepID=UPI000EACD131|nr:lytic transglycosylase domain-containing protein [Croceibacterium ferulae]